MEQEGSNASQDVPPPAAAASGGAASVGQGEQGDSWWGSWSQGWIDKVKEKSASTLEMVKKDLNEFVEVIQGDTSVAISETAEKLDDHVKNNEKKDTETSEDANSLALKKTAKFVTQGVKGFSHVLHSMSELMALEEAPDDSNEEFITLSEGSFSLQSYNRKQEKLQILQTDPGTYCNEPEGSFTDWLEVFSLDEHKEDMSNLLTQNPAVRAVYSRLVPTVISHTTFWQRYYYKVFLLESEERKREELLARADKGVNNVDDEDDDGGWGDEDDDDIEVISSHANPASTQSEIVNKTPVKVGSLDDGGDAVGTESMTTSSDIASRLMSPPSQTIRAGNKDSIDGVASKVELSKNIDIEQDSTDVIQKSCETLQDDQEVLKDTEPIHSKNSTDKECGDKKTLLLCDVSPDKDCSKLQAEASETGSISSWVSIDDDIKVKRIQGEQVMTSETRPLSDGSSSNSSGVLINKSEADDLDDVDDDFDIDLDDVDADEEELAKMVADIKNKSATGDIQDDDDWENWE